MLKRQEYEQARQKAINCLRIAKITITKDEEKNIEICDYGISDLMNIGAQILIYINTERYCAKEMILFPRQTCPEHRHPTIKNSPGKQETFRCRWGKLYLYVPGISTKNPHAKPPKGTEKFYTVWNEIVLSPGQQYTIQPNILHWFQAGSNGAVVSEFSSYSVSKLDIFTNPNIKRITEILD